MNSLKPLREAEARTLYRGFERVFWGLLIAILAGYWFKSEHEEFYLFDVLKGIGEASGFLIMILGLRLLAPRHPNFARAKWSTWAWFLAVVAFTILAFFSKSSRSAPGWDPSSWDFRLFPHAVGLAFIFILLALMLLIAWWIAGGITALAHEYHDDGLWRKARRWRVLYASSAGAILLFTALSTLTRLLWSIPMIVTIVFLFLFIALYWIVLLLFLALLRRAALLGARWGK